ncbi:MAG: thiamine pyrophosphate-dependent enzyme, partial [bacterium]
YWSGDERGSNWDRDLRVYPISVPVGSQGLHGVGASFALRYQNEEQLSVVFLGDGATSEGDMLEAMNFAGAWETPVLFFCQNNQWAISVPREKQTASENLSQKAEAFGFEGLRVDGNDPLANYQLGRDLRQYCLENSEPVFVEAVTYRLGDHTTSDDAGRYREEDEVQAWKKKDPIRRIRLLLEDQHDWSDQDEDDLDKTIEQDIETAIDEFEKLPEPDPSDMFDYLYESITPRLRDQKSTLEDETSGE